MTRRGKVRVWKMHGSGIYLWQCNREDCEQENLSGASIHWEVAQYQADEHVREFHRPEKKLSRDMGTPPGGVRFDWSDTGMHVKVRDDG